VTHEELQDLLPRYATGALRMDEAAPVQAHLASGCTRCLAEVLGRPLGARLGPTPHAATLEVETADLGAPHAVREADSALAACEPVALGVTHATSVTAAAVPEPSFTAMLPAPAPPLTAPAAAVGARAEEALAVPTLAAGRTAGSGVRRGALLLLALAAGAGVGLWVRDARTRDAARSTELARATARLTAAEQQRAALEDKLSATARELAATRAAFEKRVAAPPPPVIEETRVPPEPEGTGVRYADDRLSVHVAAMPLDALILEIGRQAGAVVRGRTPDRKVSAQFDDVLLPEALERILGAPSFSLVYDEQRRLRILDLLGPSSVTPAPVVEAIAAPQLPDPVQAAEAALPLIDKHPPIALAGSLARWFKTETLSLRELIETGFTHEDAAVRREALRTSITALENDPALAGLLDDVARIDEATLESLARRVAGDHAEEVLRQVRMQARRGDVRSKAGSVLERLRTESGARG
jgi:hypothetical protein